MSEKAVEEAASGLATRAYPAEVVQRPCLWLRERLRDRGHGTIPSAQPASPSSTFFIISAKEIPVPVPCFSHNKHGI